MVDLVGKVYHNFVRLFRQLLRRLVDESHRFGEN